MTNDVSIHIVNPDSVILKLIHDAQSLKGQYDSFSIFVDKHDDVKCCVDLDLDEVIEKEPKKLDISDWFPHLQTFRTSYGKTRYTALHLQTPDDLQRAVSWLNLDPLHSWFARGVDDGWVGGVLIGETVAPLGDWIVLSPDGKPEIWSTSMVKEHFYSSTGEIEVFKRPKKSKSAIQFNGYNGSAVVRWAKAHVQDGHVLSSVMNSTKSNSIIIVSFKEKHTATIDHPMWFVATDKGMLRMVTDTNFEAEYIREAK